MARRDKTGPMGMGPMTGRGLGDCSGSNMAKAAVLGLGGLGLGLACRQGFKRGMGGGTRPGARAGRGGPGRGMGFFFFLVVNLI